MADELNIPTHRWYEPRNNIRLPNQDFSRDWIYDSGIQKINAWINSQPWGNPVAGLFSLSEPGIWLDPSDVANLDWRRNLLTYTEQFSNASWSKTGVTVGASVTDPIGGTTAVALTSSISNAFFVQSPTSSANTAHTRSIWLKVPTGTTSINMYANDNGTGFSVQSLSLTTSWQRFSLTATSSATATAVSLQIGGGNTWPSGQEIHVWGAQLELGSVATDYQRISDVNTEVLERFPRTTMFQDRAGSTAVTTPGQSVGLRLDKSKGLVLGSELVTNGDFSNGATGWTLTGGTATVTASGGTLTVDASVTAYVAQSFTTVIGRSYRYSVQIVSQNGAAFNGIRKGDGSTGGSNIVDLRLGLTNGVGVSTGFFVATATTTFILAQANSGAVITIDNISVKELPGFHAVANSDAARGIYGIEPVGGRRNLLERTEDFTVSPWAAAVLGTSTRTNTTSPYAFGLGLVTTTSANGGIRQSRTGLTSGQPYALSFYLESAVANINVVFENGTADFGAPHAASINPSTGAFSSVSGFTSTTSVVFGTGRIYTLVSAAAGGNLIANIEWRVTAASGSFLFGRPQFERSSTATAYQRVTDQYNVTEAGKQTLHYVQYDGSDDGYVTPTINPESALVVSGSELVTNGDFASGASWTTETGWSIGSGIATKIASAANANLTQTVSIVAGRPYRVTYTLTHTAGGFQIILGGAASSVKLASGSYTDIIVAGSSNQLVSAFGNAAFAGTIDNISVREMSGVADKVQVFAGVRKLSDAATGVVIEHSATLNSNAGTFFLLAPNTTASTNAIFASKGSLPTFGSGGAADIGAAPVTRVLSGIGDIAADTSILRMNGTQVATSAADQGTGNFLAYPLYIGRRGGTTLPFNGRDYGIITRFGANLDASTIAATESWLNQKTGAF